MKSEFLIQRNGKIFVLYAGLLDLAHERGLRDLRVELVQSPSASNSFVAIAKAIATVKFGDTFAIFEEIGDASAANTSKTIAPHIIRMAATRAKARALRDALNIGVTALEELKGDGEVRQKSVTTRRLKTMRLACLVHLVRLVHLVHLADVKRRTSRSRI